MSTSASVRSRRSFHTNRSPSSVPVHIDAGRVAWSGRPACSRRRNAIVTIDRTKQTAVTHRVFSGPTVRDQDAADAGTDQVGDVVVGLVQAVRRGRDSIPPPSSRPAASIRAPRSLPGRTSHRARPAARAPAPTDRWCPRRPGSRPPTARRVRPTTSDVGRRPNRSTTVPENRLASSSGTVAAPATIAASVARPVCSSTSHGSATMMMPLPVADSSVARLIRANGPNRRAVVAVVAVMSGFLQDGGDMTRR